MDVRPPSDTTGDGDEGSTGAPQHAPPRQHATQPEVGSTPSARGRAPGPFAMMVDAFISSFRQAANNSQAQSITRSSTNTQPQRQTPAATPPQAMNAPTTPSAGGTNQEGAFETTPDTQSQPAPSTSEADTPVMQQPPPASTIPNPLQADSSDTNTAQDASTDGPSPAGDGINSAASDAPRTIYFRIPLPNPSGPSGILSFTPGPIPIPAHQPEPRPPYASNRPSGLAPDRGNGLASGFHMPASPILVPLGSSPLPFSFIFDVQTNTAWPITNISTRPPGAMPTGEEEQFIAGPPFHIGLNISFGPAPQPEVPDPERAARFVDSLEQADAELRERMAQLGMGAIGDYGGRQENEGGEGALGCGICLDEYPDEDRPEWIGGQASKDEEVVAVPCAGHHTLHRRCLTEWLAKTPPSEWTCPFCRAGLDKAKVDSSASNAPQSNNTEAVKKAEQESKSRTLREEVRLREKARGWRCDSPACLLRYPCRDGDGIDHQADELVSLLPCRHKLHLDCLCTSMRLEQLDAFEPESEEEGDNDDNDDNNDDALDGVAADEESPAGDVLLGDLSAKSTVGKWVTCPTCRTEAWAELPIKKKRRVKRSQDIRADDDHLHEIEALAEAIDYPSKTSYDLPMYGARARAMMLDAQRAKEARVEDVADDDSDGAVETSLL